MLPTPRDCWINYRQLRIRRRTTEPRRRPRPPRQRAKKFLRVLIERPGGDDVNVRVPLTFVRSGVKLAGVLPPKVLAKLQEEGIDPILLKGRADEAIDELHVDMETKSGKHIRVFCE